jgi:hypothetical protein
MNVGQMNVGQMIIGQMNCWSNELSVKWMSVRWPRPPSTIPWNIVGSSLNVCNLSLCRHKIKWKR